MPLSPTAHVYILAVAALVLFLVGLGFTHPGIFRFTGGDALADGLHSGCVALVLFVAALAAAIGCWAYASRHAEQLSTVTRWVARVPTLALGLFILIAWIVSGARSRQRRREGWYS